MTLWRKRLTKGFGVMDILGLLWEFQIKIIPSFDLHWIICLAMVVLLEKSMPIVATDGPIPSW